MKMSPAILTAAACAMILSSCSPEPARLQSLTEEVEGLAAQQRQLAAQVSAHRKLVQTAAAERERLAAGRAQTELLIRKAGADLSALKAEFSAYKLDYRRAIQARANGMKLSDLTVGTKTHTDVVVSSVTDSLLTVLTNEGIAKVPLADAPPAIQDLFGYDPSVIGAIVSTPPSFDFLALAIAEGKMSAAENTRISDELKAAKKRKKSPPKYLKAPPVQIGPVWDSRSAFEGSYWAPIKKKP